VNPLTGCHRERFTSDGLKAQVFLYCQNYPKVRAGRDTKPVLCVAYTPDGTRVLSGGEDGIVYVMRLVE
jgi:WD40 repeat protein